MDEDRSATEGNYVEILGVHVCERIQTGVPQKGNYVEILGIYVCEKIPAGVLLPEGNYVEILGIYVCEKIPAGMLLPEENDVEILRISICNRRTIELPRTGDGGNAGPGQFCIISQRYRRGGLVV